MKLVIAEKPSVSNALAPVIGATTRKDGYIEGNGYYVSWCFGHLIGQAFPEEYGDQWKGSWSFDMLPMLPDKWRYNVMPDKKAQFAILKKLMLDSSVTEIICATDAKLRGLA